MYSTEDEEERGLWPMDIDAFAGFEEILRCRAASTHPDATLKERLLYGGKMLLPLSCLETLSSLNVVYPLQFKVSPKITSTTNTEKKKTFLGVLEFSAPEGTAYLPDWALKTLDIKDRALIQVQNVSLPIGRFVKFQPTTLNFLSDISDPRAVLEHTLRSYTCFSLNDTIQFSYLGIEYGLRVEEVRPDDGRGAILAVETDLQVDFSPPPGYVEPTTKSASLASSLGKSPTLFSTSGSKSFFFTGVSNKLKSTPNTNTSSVIESGELKPVKLPPGTLFFGSAQPSTSATKKKEESTKSIFESGKGRSLK